ncbi:hypothetical protein ACFV0H_32580 [Streptomyces erythrochromogenes]
MIVFPALPALAQARSPKEGPAPGRRKGWRAGPAEPGTVFVMFFQRPIYE